MRPYVIMADATCDLNEDFQKEYDIQVIPGHVIYPDKTERTSFLKWESEEARARFYAELKKNPEGFSTSPANVAEFAEVFRGQAAQGHDILVLSISGAMSGAYNFMRQARELVLQEYPECRIECVDSRRYGPGFGLMTVQAALRRKEGKSLEETVNWLEENKNRFHQAGWLDDLSFVARKGRLTHAKAFFGTLAGVKPIGEFDYNGLTTVIAKIKGARKAYEALLSYIEQTGENLEDQIVFIAQSDRLPQALEYKKRIEERFHPKAVYVNEVFPLCSINIGPGLMAAYYMGTPISENLEKEKKIFEKLLGGTENEKTE